MLAVVLSSAVVGIDGFLIRVEIDSSTGVPAFNIVGLPDAAVRESRQRIITAIKNSELSLPSRRITVNLAPADIKKEGSVFDLPMALGMLVATQQIPGEKLKSYLVMGELSLSGKIRSIKGTLSSALMAKEEGFCGMILPYDNAKEASIVDELDIVGVKTLNEAVEFLRDTTGEIRTPDNIGFENIDFDKDPYDFRDVKGQDFAKRAIEIAAAGGHNVLMVGPPGSGKTMLAKRISGILPAMNIDEALETTKIHSIVGMVSRDYPIIKSRPFRSPHHTISDAALVGGGSYPKPGEVSLAHNGVLFLDELPEFRRNVLEVLRQPLEENSVIVSRAKQTLTFPAKIMFIAAMNPCPCGYYGSEIKECRCTPVQVQRYRGKISGPLLDRIDLHIEVSHVAYDELIGEEDGEESKIVRQRVDYARNIQKDRIKTGNIYTNSEMTSREIKKYCKLDEEGSRILKDAVKKFSLSARAYARILKVARTIADLEDSEAIAASHVAEAVGYRLFDKF